MHEFTFPIAMHTEWYLRFSPVKNKTIIIIALYLTPPPVGHIYTNVKFKNIIIMNYLDCVCQNSGVDFSSVSSYVHFLCLITANNL